MPAYVILDVNVTDPEIYESYKQSSGPTLAAFGGKFIVRGGAHEVLEGDHEPHRIVVVEFPSLERAKEWYSSDAYAGPKALRHQASTASMILVEGSAASGE